MTTLELGGVARKSLAQQHRGGIANLSGGVFEDHFALWRCLIALSLHEQGTERRKLATQLKNAPVDDWVEKHPNGQHHFQLKRTNSILWSAVATDFKKQLKTAASVTLVVHSGKAATRLKRSQSRVTNARVETFPGSIRPNVVMKSPRVNNALRLACVKPTPTVADLELLWSVIDTAWKNARKPGYFVGIDRVIEQLRDPYVPVRVRWTPTPEWKRAEKLLAAIAGLSCRIDGGHFFFTDGAGTRGRVSCRSTDFAEFVQLVLLGKITTTDDVGAHL